MAQRALRIDSLKSKAGSPTEVDQAPERQKGGETKGRRDKRGGDKRGGDKRGGDKRGGDKRGRESNPQFARFHLDAGALITGFRKIFLRNEMNRSEERRVGKRRRTRERT